MDVNVLVASSPTRRQRSDSTSSISSTSSESVSSTTSLISPNDDTKHDVPASWRTLPHKPQLIALAFCRFSEPLTNTSLLSYLYYLLLSYPTSNGEPPSPATIARQAGILQSSFALAQCVTGMFWGRLSDTIGRKPVILMGLAGTTISILGFAFADSFEEALAWRILAGVVNGNVGVLRTVVSETVREKKHQARAFLIMPMCFNIGIVLGPAIGGALADPRKRWGGVWERWEWTERWKFALPQIVCAGFLMFSWVVGFFLLQETLPTHHRRQHHSAQTGILSRFRRSAHPSSETTPLLPSPTSTPSKVRPKLSQIFTPNVLKTLLCFTLLPLHNATWLQLYPLFLSSPLSPSSPKFPHLTGGLGLSASDVGSALSLLGIIGIILQLVVYPRIAIKWGLIRSYRTSLGWFIWAYLLTPFLVLLVRRPETETVGFTNLAGGPLVWAGIFGILAIQVTARTFSFPANIALLTNAVEVEGVLGTVHGVGSSLMSAARAVGPAVGGWALAKGMEREEGKGEEGVQWVFWGLGVVALAGWAGSWRVREGRGLGVKD